MLSQHQSIFKKIYTSWKADICQGWEFDVRLFVLSRKIAHLEKWPWAIRTFKKAMWAIRSQNLLPKIQAIR